MRLFSRALVLAVLLACSTPTVWAAGEDETKDNDGGEVKRGDDDVANVDVDEKQAEGPPVEEKSSEDRGRKVQPAPVVPESPTGHLDGLAKKLKVHEVDVSFYHGFFASLSVIIVSELGDKTWFIAVIMSMKHSRLTVFSGAIAALALMTVLSACLGWVTQLIPRVVTYYLSTALFALFGLKMLHEGWYMNPEEGQEVLKEAGEEVQKHELEREGPKYADLESGVKGDTRGLHAGLCYSNPWVIFSFISAIFVEAFTLTFIAEWGDRSQLTTIILAAREDIAGVIIGGVLGHALCTGIAVIGGKIVAQRISVRNVTLIGGVVFILFALSAFFINQPEPEPIVMDV